MTRLKIIFFSKKNLVSALFPTAGRTVQPVAGEAGEGAPPNPAPPQEASAPVIFFLGQLWGVGTTEQRRIDRTSCEHLCQISGEPIPRDHIIMRIFKNNLKLIYLNVFII